MIFKFRKYISIGNKDMMVYSDHKHHTQYFSFEDRRSGMMQSTGIHDLNSSEIYEEDIVKINENVYGVVWDYVHAQFALLKNKRLHRDLNHKLKDSIVIGNAYQNTDLTHLVE